MMARSLGDLKYFYYDCHGTKYRPTTNDNDEGLALDGMSGEELRYTVKDGGDHTQCQKRELGTPVMGSGRGNG